jgi:hypothetical protein
MAATIESCSSRGAFNFRLAAYAKDYWAFERKGLVLQMKRNSLRARNGQQEMNEIRSGSGFAAISAHDWASRDEQIPLRNSVNLTITSGTKAMAQFARGTHSLGPVQTRTNSVAIYQHNRRIQVNNR